MNGAGAVALVAAGGALGALGRAWLAPRVARMAAARPAENSREFYQLDGLREALRLLEEDM